MGGAKRMMMELEDNGWSPPDKHVCPDCVQEAFLKQVIADNADEPVCDYCGNEGKGNDIAAPVSAIMELIANLLWAHYAEPGSAGLPRDSGEWVGEERFTDTADALEELGLQCQDDLFEDISGAFLNDVWYPCAQGYWLAEQPNIEMGYAWRSFVRQVKHQSRFFFDVPGEEDQAWNPSAHTPGTILQEIGALVHSIPLVRDLPPGTVLYRARVHDTPLTQFKELGPPPEEIVSAGRMNPAGIAYLYLAQRKDTAVAETLRDEPKKNFSIATFQTKAALTIVDLSRLPELPSRFDGDRREQREGLLFLRTFVEEISAHIARDGKEHINYVPSQIVSEYFARVCVGPGGNKVRGLAWTSAVDGEGVNVVLFPENSYQFRWDQLVDLVAAEHVDPAGQA